MSVNKSRTIQGEVVFKPTQCPHSEQTLSLELWSKDTSDDAELNILLNRNRDNPAFREKLDKDQMILLLKGIKEFAEEAIKELEAK